MNGKPHAHKIQVHNAERRWYITYGDQGLAVDKPRHYSRWGFTSERGTPEEEAVVLRKGIAEIILKHDIASREVAAVEAVIPDLFHNRWGSEQLEDV